MTYLANSSTVLTGTVYPGAGAVLGPETGKAEIRCPSGVGGKFGRDAFRVNPQVNNVSFRNLDIATDHKDAAAVKVFGDGAKLSNVRQTGGGFVLRCGGEGSPEGTDNLDADLLYATSGNVSGGYSMGWFGEFNGKPIPTRNVTIRRFYLTNDRGPHTSRHEHSENCTWGDPSLVLPELANERGPGPLLPTKMPGKGFAGFIQYRGPTAGGCALCINHSKNSKLLRLKLDGTLAVGPIQIWAIPHPDWRDENCLIQDCDIKAITFNRGVKDATVQNCLLGYVGEGGSDKYPKSTVRFVNCLFTVKPPVNTNWLFTGCMWSGKKLGIHGDA